MSAIIKVKHKTSRGHFEIKITEKEKELRVAYQDSRFKFSINVINIDYPNWNMQFADVRVGMKSIEDKEKLIVKLINVIKTIINQDEQGDFYLGDITLDNA